MKVTLINYTPWALETLIFTKSTRLRMTGRSLQEICDWPQEKKLEEWAYMQGTIKSSWEFCDYYFMIEGVTRAFTHQLVRHRIGTSFAQQAQRVVDMSDFEYLTTGNILADKTEELTSAYDGTMHEINLGYQHLIQLGANPQDARGVLPTNILTNICYKVNLRALHEQCMERLCVKAQGEMQDVVRELRKAVIAIHPWAEPALRVACAQRGVCAFPTYAWEGENSCPIKGGVYNPDTSERWDGKELITVHQACGEQSYPALPLSRNEIQMLWETTRAEAQPVAPKGDR